MILVMLCVFSLVFFRCLVSWVRVFLLSFMWLFFFCLGDEMY